MMKKDAKSRDCVHGLATKGSLLFIISANIFYNYNILFVKYHFDGYVFLGANALCIVVLVCHIRWNRQAANELKTQLEQPRTTLHLTAQEQQSVRKLLFCDEIFFNCR